MASLHRIEKTDNPAKRGGNAGHDLYEVEQEPQAITDPPLDDTLAHAISEAAYYRAEARGFESGHELEDWVEAERQVVGTNKPATEAARA